MEKYIKKFKEYLKHANPSFTEYSLKRTLEVIIIQVDNRNFIDKIDSNIIEDLKFEIDEENIKYNIRN